MLGIVEDGEEPLAVLGSRLGGQLQGGGTDAARRSSQHAQESVVVVRIEERTEVGDHILHLAPVEEALPADDAVGDAPLPQHLLELPRLGIHPVEDGEVGPRSGL